MENFELLHRTDILNVEILNVSGIVLMLVNLFQLKLFFLSVDFGCRVASIFSRKHRLENVCVLLERRFVLSKVNFYFGHKSDLIACQNSKNALFSQQVQVSSLEAHKIRIIGRIFTSECFSEQRHNSFDVTANILF